MNSRDSGDTGDFVEGALSRAGAVSQSVSVSSWQLSSFSSIWDVSNGSVATPEPVTGDLVTA